MFYEQRIKYIERNDELQDRRTARICSLLANIHSKKGKTFTEDDFIPKIKIEEKKQTVKSMETTLKAITIMFGGNVEG